MSDLLMLDSGAFSVWSQGAEIDIDEYVRFCREHSGVSYYINLDVIPGKPDGSIPRTPDLVEECCRQGWENYLYMKNHLPEEKVVPVFHRGERFEWLERYLDSGTTYIGIGQLGVVTKESRDWLKKVKDYLLDSSGKPIVRVHGFAVTSFRWMQDAIWYSVDSSSWLKQASYGQIYIPKIRKGHRVFSEVPLSVNVSPKSPFRNKKQKHIVNLSPTVKKQVMDYLESLKVRMGEFEIVEVENGYKKSENELWWDKKKTKVLRIIQKGARTCHHYRFWINSRYMHRANEELPVEDIYFAGGEGSVLDLIEFKLKKRLVSYHKVHSSSTLAGKCFRRWNQLLC